MRCGPYVRCKSGEAFVWRCFPDDFSVNVAGSILQRRVNMLCFALPDPFP